MGRGGWLAASRENADIQNRVPVEGKVLLEVRAGGKRGDEGAVVLVLAADKSPAKRLPIAGLRPDDPPSSAGGTTSAALAELSGAVARADASGGFRLFVPAAGSYRILVISGQARRVSGVKLDQSDLADLKKYFDAPDDLLQQRRYRWLTKELRLGAGPISVEFSE
jgi:hypothetical protein